MPFNSTGGYVTKIAYDKANEAIEKSTTAESKAASADTKSVEAVNTATEAKLKADLTKEQLNNIIIESGTSDAEVIQARGEYAVLDERLESMTIRQQPTEPVGVPEGTFWLDESDNTFQVTVFQELDEKVKTHDEQLAQKASQSGLNSANSLLLAQDNLINTDIAFDNAMWSWWIHPLAAVRDDKTYIGSVNKTGMVSVKSYSHTDGKIESFDLFQGSVDDHTAAAIVFSKLGTPIVFYAQHGIDYLIRYRKGNTVGSIADLGEERTITMPHVITYSQAVVDSLGRIHLFVRSSRQYWSYLRSDDYGETWAVNTLLVDFAHMEQEH